MSNSEEASNVDSQSETDSTTSTEGEGRGVNWGLG